VEQAQEVRLTDSFYLPLLGGMLIGLASTLLLLFYGRIFGISGIVAGLLGTRTKDYDWRIAIVLGFLAGGLILLFVKPDALENTVIRTPTATIIAGLLVGYGTRLGNGCTSGHGVCGISRFSKRSIVATLSFILAGVGTVAFVNLIFGGRV
jgi:uncharacterized protein